MSYENTFTITKENLFEVISQNFMNMLQQELNQMELGGVDKIESNDLLSFISMYLNNIFGKISNFDLSDIERKEKLKQLLTFNILYDLKINSSFMKIKFGEKK